MESIKRCSPARFDGQPLNTEQQGDWTVVLEYEAEGKEPWVIDLSHRARWDLQDADISKQQPWGINIPETPGQCVLENGVLINRMNRTQASIWHLFGEDLAVPDDQAFTDVTDATVFLVLLGKDIFAITEKLTSLDFLDPLKKPPFLLQGPFLHVPCQIVILGNIPERSAILFTCSRGYAQDMIAAILEAGAEFELHPAGENAFRNWVNQISD
ncbi:MAG: sarcosine oxidase subunit gamma SoxG [Desulfobacterales bacterium]|jgi:hypothetical protein